MLQCSPNLSLSFFLWDLDIFPQLFAFCILAVNVTVLLSTRATTREHLEEEEEVFRNRMEEKNGGYLTFIESTILFPSLSKASKTESTRQADKCVGGRENSLIENARKI